MPVTYFIMISKLKKAPSLDATLLSGANKIMRQYHGDEVMVSPLCLLVLGKLASRNPENVHLYKVYKNR